MASSIRNISHYYVHLELAHTILAQACLTVLLAWDDKTDIKRLFTFHNAFYAAKRWVDHVKIRECGVGNSRCHGMRFGPKEGVLRCMGLDTQLPRRVVLLSRYHLVTPPCTMQHHAILVG